MTILTNAVASDEENNDSNASNSNNNSNKNVRINNTTNIAMNNRAPNRYSKKEDSTTPTTSGAMTLTSSAYAPELLPMYYARLFPFDLIYQWLSYDPSHSNITSNTSQNSNSTNHSAPAPPPPTTTTTTASTVFGRREFSFTMELAPGEEIYLRYQSFPSARDLQLAVTKRVPTKIDIGAIFSHAPTDHHTVPKGAFQPHARELVFDIDLTDYDGVRHCGCSGASICPICWQFMPMAVAVVDQGLRRDFGFSHIAWFYSGRRGIHCWVCDERARDLTDAGRSAVANYFTVSLGTDENNNVDLPDKLPPSLVRALATLEPFFMQYVLPSKEHGGHGLLASEQRWTPLLETLPVSAAPVRDKLLASWTKAKCRSTPSEKWRELETHLRAFAKTLTPSGQVKHAKKETTLEVTRVQNWCTATIFRYTYPRLDINVSKMRNHLLKSPFCVHPKTGRVCVPIRTTPDSRLDPTFDPFAVPTLAQLGNELDQYHAPPPGNTPASKDDDDDDEVMADNDGNNSGPNDGSDAATTKTNCDWEKTSLKKYYEPFVKEFLEPLQKALFRTQRDQNEQQAAMAGDF